MPIWYCNLSTELTKTLSFRLFYFWRFCSLGSWRVVEVTLGYRTFEQRHSNVVLPFWRRNTVHCFNVQRVACFSVDFAHWEILKWLTAGPPGERPRQLFTFRTNPRSAAGSSGTPKSGHAMKWNCFTILSIACPVRVTWNVRTTWSGNSWMSVMVMRMSFNAMLPLSGQYWAHFTRPFSSRRVSYKECKELDILLWKKIINHQFHHQWQIVQIKK